MLRTFTSAKMRFFAVLSAALVASAAAQISTHQIVVGGLNASGSAGGNPPVASSGDLVSGTLDFTYDQSLQQLTVVVNNTTPVVSWRKNALITQIFFNIPQQAVTSMSLLSQTAATGFMNWQFAKDFNLENGSSLGAGPFGDFGVRLKTPNGIGKGIKNPAATNVATWNHVTGPVTFVFDVAGPGAANLTAGAWGSSLSDACNQSNAVMKFQGAGPCGNGSAWVTNWEECSAGGWFIGDPRPGATIYAVQTAADGCYGCIICSTDPGPTTAFGITVPVGLPYTVILSTQFPNNTNSNTSSVPVLVPDLPGIVGTVFYCATVIVDTATQSAFDISDQWTVTILPPLP